MKCRIKALGLAAMLSMALFVMIPAANADIKKDAPWHPVAKAYLFGIFVSDLRPADWDGIARRFATTGRADQGGKSAYDLLRAATGVERAVAELRDAVSAKDRKALRTASTRALSLAVRQTLRGAELLLTERPSAVLGGVRAAQDLFRPFDGFIRQADPDGYRAIGLAWLELATVAGRKLRSGQIVTQANRDAFAAAARIIGDYLIENYESASDAEIARRGPIPARGRGKDPSWRPAAWLPPDANLNDQNPLPRLVLNFEQRGIDERDLFLVAYGDMLFDSPEIFGEPARRLGISCATCHNRSDANQALFIPGLSARPGTIDVDSSHFNRIGNDLRIDPLDTPSLRGIRFMAPYGRNGRTASLRQFARNVVVGEFAGPEPTPLMLDALVAYMNEFDFLPAPYLDRDGRMNKRASASAKRGEALFNKPFAAMGGKSCATCHIPSGNFLDGRRHDIGSTEQIAPPAKARTRDGAFDTPTLLSIAHNAPYFHDGSLPTLGAVVGWFDKRFGLKLAAREKKDLTAYLTAVGTGEEPYEKFTDEKTRFRLDFDELSTFLSTLNELIPARDAFHARLLIRTVARDLRLDASGLKDMRMAPKVYELSDMLDMMDKAIAAENWDRTATLWTQYQEKEKRYARRLH